MLGINKILKRFIGDKAEKDIGELRPIVEEINMIFNGLSGISNDELRNKSSEIKSQIQEELRETREKINQLKAQVESQPDMDVEAKEAIYHEVDSLTKSLDQEIETVLANVLPQAFAIVKETARRFKESESVEVTALDYDRELATQKKNVSINGDKAQWNSTWEAAGNDIKWEMVHYDVQLIGGIALHRGKVAEMQTGEGKTLVATLPVFLNALAGNGVHMITVNDYLAKRDSQWMAPLYEFHGLTVDCIDFHKPNSDERRKAYQADITFGTNNEFGFDYLRDNMARAPEHLVQRKHHYAIIDEVDSVLIDEARTPLIISGPTPRGDDQEYDELKPKVQMLYNAQKKLTTELLSEAKKTLAGWQDGDVSKEDITEGGLKLFRAFRGLPKNKALIKFLSEDGIKQLLLKTEGFYMQDNSKDMWKADEILYFTIDEKNNQVELTEKGIQLISSNMEDENFFLMPDLASEIVDLDTSGKEEKEIVKLKEDLMSDYAVKSSRIHTINQLLKSYALFEKDVDYVVMNNKVMIVDEQTGRMMDGRRYSDGLHQAIEAKESVKVEAATQTYATVTLQNYFRMYHKLSGMTGTAETEAGEFWEIYELDVMIIPTNRPLQRKDMEDLVYKTKREKYNAVIDRVVELQNEGNPILVGTTTVEVSELLSKMLTMRGINHQVLNAKMHQKEAEVVALAGKSGTVTIATNMAGRGTDIKLGEGVKEAGGLAIIGTERHDSRRVDRQLRGRSGRQGDPGLSQFFVSLDDDLMRLFGSDKIAKMMDRMGHKEGEVIQHGMISKSIERAQKKVEENNFGVRKRLLEYDDVMNSQREVIYKRRRHALFGERLKLDISNMFYDLAENVILNHQNDKNFEAFKLSCIQTFVMESPFTEEEFKSGRPDDLALKLFQAAEKNYQVKMQRLAENAYPVIKDVYEDESNHYENIMIPITDGRKNIQIGVNLEKAYNTNGKEITETLEKNVALSVLDDKWKDHLRKMDDLRSNVQFASHEQKDPLLIYKFESLELFKSMILVLNSEIASFLLKANLPMQTGPVRQAQTPKRNDLGKVKTQKDGVDNLNQRMSGGNAQAGRPQAAPTGQRVQVTAPIVKDKKVGRNDPCPCGSGKKYKQCHG